MLDSLIRPLRLPKTAFSEKVLIEHNWGVLMKLGICEDDPFTLSTLSASLTAEGVEVVFAENNAADALASFEQTTPNAVIIDLHLGEGPTGLDLSKQMRAKNPKVGIVYLTSFESPKLLDKSFTAFPSGAQYLSKRDIASVKEILEAVQLAISKNRSSSELKPSNLATLTPRQLEVLEHIAEGWTNQEIAKKLELSPKTVEGTVLRIAKRLNLQTDPNTNQRIQMAKAYLRGIGRFGQ